MYNLHQLGWYSFQQLCLTVAREIFGQTTMSFLSSKDGGRDGSFTGKWINNNGQTYQGQFVIQCKYSSKLNANLRLSDLKDELPKAASLAKKGLCDIYILITNAGISGPIQAKIQAQLQTIGVDNVLIYGSDWLFSVIRENKVLRRDVPRIYGLGDLSQILDKRVYDQGKVLLNSLKDDLAKVVITGAYQKAAKALDEHGFVLLIGEPAAGKTTIASLLALGALDQWQASTMKLDNATQVIKHWNTDEVAQFFWIDDAFGVTQYESNLTREWNHYFAQIKAMVKTGAKIVMTSRDYIYNHARRELKEGAFPLLKESQVVIDVQELTPTEKRQILYNHIKLGDQTIQFKKSIKPFLEEIASNTRFVPETARRLASRFFTKDFLFYEFYIEEYVSSQESLLIEVITNLDQDSQAGLALNYMSDNKLASPIELKAHEEQAIQRIGSSLGGCTSALDAMNGNLVQHVQSDDGAFWRFKHPTIGDAFAKYVAKSPELIEIYLQGTPVAKLIQQITCGDVHLEKAIIVQPKYYSQILDRIENFKHSTGFKSSLYSSWRAKSDVQTFLSRRCSKGFLMMYVERHPEILDQVASPGLYLDTVSEVDLAIKLFAYGLLPEGQRKTFVTKVSEYAVEGRDLYAMRTIAVQSLFTEKELTDLKNDVKKELLPKLALVSEDLQYRYDKKEDGDPESYMDNFCDTLNVIKSEFSDDPIVLFNVSIQEEIIQDWIDSHIDENPILPPREKLGFTKTADDESQDRSIFDDIDF